MGNPAGCACFVGHGHAFMAFGQCRPADRTVVLPPCLGPVALDARGRAPNSAHSQLCRGPPCHNAVMAAITSDLLTDALGAACRSFAPGELAYLALTSKPEHAVRDRMAWVLHTGMPGCVTAREWGPGGGRARSDLAVLDEISHEPLAILEMKAAYTFDFARESQRSAGAYLRCVADDLDKAHAAGVERTRIFALLLLTHPASAPVQPTAVVKYGAEIARSLVGRSAAELAVVARENAARGLRAMGTVTDGAIPLGRAFGIDVSLNYLLVSA